MTEDPPSRVASHAVYPIFVAAADRIELKAFTGTGFLLGSGILVTCWHCIAKDLPADERYIVAYERPGSKHYRLAEITTRSQHPNGLDLGVARVPLTSNFGLRLSKTEAETGTDVWSYGYPLTKSRLTEHQRKHFTLEPRFLQGYVMRSFFYEQGRFGRTPAYELDMPTPEGLSGGPVVRVGTREVVGVVFGTHETYTIAEFASEDPETGEVRPESRRIVAFGLAHFTESLHTLAGPATEGLTLGEMEAIGS